MDTDTDISENCYTSRNVSFFYNNSGKVISDHWRHRDYLIVVLGMMVCFIVIFSNLLVIGAILKNRRFHFPIYYLLGNLALADLFSGTTGLVLQMHLILQGTLDPVLVLLQFSQKLIIIIMIFLAVLYLLVFHLTFIFFQYDGEKGIE